MSTKMQQQIEEQKAQTKEIAPAATANQAF
jgi:hypothetical protein